MKQIIFFDVKDNEFEQLKNFCDEKFDCKLFTNPLNDKTQLTDEIKQAEIISCFTFSRVSADILAQFPNLKLIALRSVGFNHIDIDYCKKNNIQVVNSFGYGNITVAEFTFGLMFDVMRKISRSYMNLKNEHLGNDVYTGLEFKNKTIGIIGTGAIGSEVVRIAKGIGMNVLAYDIFPNDKLVEKYDFRYVELDELLKNADIISLHTPLTKDNFHMINKEKITLMKQQVIIINTARGELIDTKALYEALSENRIFAAGLDVLESENILTQPEKTFDFDYLTDDVIRQTLINDRLLKLHNVVVTPHIAYNTQEAQDRILNITMDNISSFFKGKIKNSVLN
jgi:D-lactate dehydrogenase